MTEEELRRLCDFLYRRTGMIFAESKRYYVQRRLTDRMLATNSFTFASYFARLSTDDQGEMEQFINAFTVNETYFYREDYQLRCLTTDLLRERIQRKPGSGTFRIWSVPCATGEEPFSLAIWLLENWPQVDRYDIEICGSDIDTRALSAAKLGIYGKRALMRLDEHVIEKYFLPRGFEQWQIIEELRQSIRFTPVNLVDPFDMRKHGRFDIIFCRNVLIYFDEASRRLAAENLYEALLPGGFICLGHTESMSRISPLFEVRRFNDGIFYQKPVEA